MASSSSEDRPRSRVSREHADAHAFAALDLGTNNCRLLVARPAAPTREQPHGVRVIDSFSRIVRLGEGVSATGVLGAEAIDRTISALKMCKAKLERHSVTQARCVATEACRQAGNSDEFLEKVKRETGITLDIISNEEEARLAFAGCASLLDETARHAIVFDIGGGSTEFLWVDTSKKPDVKDWLSVPYGVMNLSEKFGGNAYVELYFPEIVERLTARLREFDARNDIARAIEQGGVQMLSTSGTVTTLAAVHLGLPRYDRGRIDGITLPQEAVREAARRVLALTPAERMAHPCVGPDRSDFILSGCAIYEAIAGLWPTASITIADRGVREGIILSFAQAYHAGAHE